MSWQFPALAILGASKSGLSIGYRLINLDGTEAVAFTTTDVNETSVPGNYTVTNGITLDDNFSGRIEWGVSGTAYAEEDVSFVADAITAVGLAMAGIYVTVGGFRPSAQDDLAAAVDASTSVVAIKAKTDQLQFTVDGVVADAGVISGGGGDATEATSNKILKVVQAISS